MVLSDSDANVRYEVATALGDIRSTSPDVLAALLSVSEKDSDDSVKKEARRVHDALSVLAKLSPGEAGSSGVPTQPEPAPPVQASASPGPAVAPPASHSVAVKGAPQRTAFALVVGIEHYRDLPAPPGAKADAQAFADVLRNTLGLPDSNIRLALEEHATRTDIERQLSWLKANVSPGGRAYFYFSGHGAPNAGKGTAMLVPYDGDSQAIEETSLPLDGVLTKLGESKGKEALAFVDACFSGAGGRSILPRGARPLIHLQEIAGPGSVAVFAGSSGTQISGPSAEGDRGAFTKYLLQGIGEAKADANGDGQLTLEELATWVTPRVEREAKQQSREQTPKLIVGSKVGQAKDVAVAWGLK
jgi:uncharacterized caspase-like protein